jgi:protocatechuate 3,4-dioxygenase beta subunit
VKEALMIGGRQRCAGSMTGLVLVAFAWSAALASAALTEAPGASATLRGKAVSVTGAPVPNVKIVFSHHMPNEPSASWAVTSGADGTFSAAVPGSVAHWVGMSVEGPAGGRLALAGVVGEQGVPLFQDDPPPVTLLFAPATSRVRGTVKGAGGEPVAGATVTLSLTFPGTRHASSQRTATTDGQGRYEIANLAAGRYAVSSVDPPAGSAWIRLYSWKPGGVRWVQLGEVAASEEDFRLPQGARLAGRALDESGKPVAGAAVSCSLDEATEEGPKALYQMPGQWYSGHATTDAQGRYVIGGLTKETYRVVVQPPAATEVAPAVLRGINAPDRGDVELQDVTLYKGGKLIGLVIGPDDKPLAGATVSLPVAALHSGTRPTATADAAGRFVMTGLPTDKYAVTVSPPAGCLACEQVFENLPVIGGLAVEHQLKLTEGATIAGTVTGPDSKPVPGVRLAVTLGYGRGPQGVTDAQGQFKITGIPPALRQPAPPAQPLQITMGVSPPETAAYLLGTNVPLKDLAAGRTTPVDVRLAAGCSITGVVTGPDSKPVPRCQVSAFQRMGQFGYTSCASGQTGPDGRYRLAHVPVGKWQVSVVPPAGLNLMPEASPEKTLAADQTETADLALKSGAVVLGRVTSTRGHPVSGATVRLEAGRDAATALLPGLMQGGKVAFTDPKGAFRIDSVPAGSHKVHCSPLDPALLVEPAEIKVAATGEHKVDLVAHVTGSLRGTVHDAAGNPLGYEFLSVRLEQAEAAGKGQAPTTYPDAGGQFRLTSIVPGKYSLKVVLNKRGEEKNLAAPPPVEVLIGEGRENKVDIKVGLK